MRNPSFDQLAQRDLALTIPCRYCGAATGAGCVTKGRDGQLHPLENFPAHHARINRAERLQRMQDAEKPDTASIARKLGEMRAAMVIPL